VREPRRFQVVVMMVVEGEKVLVQVEMMEMRVMSKADMKVTSLPEVLVVGRRWYMVRPALDGVLFAVIIETM
jgi:hypothetical protein